jgi:hypothetical protein
MSYWKIDPEEETTEFQLNLVDPEGWRRASAKWDGCVNYWLYHNTPLGEDGNYIHICDIDEEIVRLQELKRTAANYFAEHRPDGKWEVEAVESDNQIAQIIEAHHIDYKQQ